MPAVIPIDNTWGKNYILHYSVAQHRWLLLTAGAVLIGVLVGVLYGILTLQYLVGVIWVLDTLHTIFVTHMVYTYLVTNFGDYLALGHNIWSFNLHVVVTHVPSSHHKWVVDTWLGSAAICDIFVSAAIVRSLWRSRTGMRRTNNMINNLIVWTVNAGILTSTWAFLDIILFTSSRNTLIHDFFNVMLAKLYANSLFATLNHRHATSVLDESSAQSISLTALNLSRGGNSRDAENKSLRFENEESVRELELGAGGMD
ncbi:hypothetical protein BU17DRAFT_61896 [Hysterangium stoloniferum]|nr:hypothetical protein BU17DRAFT_61896 [Hysterangium stoloniferum]